MRRESSASHFLLRAAPSLGVGEVRNFGLECSPRVFKKQINTQNTCVVPAFLKEKNQLKYVTATCINILDQARIIKFTKLGTYIKKKLSKINFVLIFLHITYSLDSSSNISKEWTETRAKVHIIKLVTEVTWSTVKTKEETRCRLTANFYSGISNILNCSDPAT